MRRGTAAIFVRKTTAIVFLAVALGCAPAPQVRAATATGNQEKTPVEAEALDRIPVKEITVFKDGHAFVLHEGVKTVQDDGVVLLDRLPTPVIGTFWPFASGDGVQLESVVAARRTILSTHAALSIRELLQANEGANVRIKRSDDSFAATVVGIPRRETVPRSEPGGTNASGPGRSADVILLKTAEGIRVIPLNSIQEVTFIDEPRSEITFQKQQNVLALKLRWPDGKQPKSARVGMVYLQKGIRWIPSYRLELDEKGWVTVKLQATLINEMVDLDNVVANLVIGVPHFAFKETIDPISLGKTVAHLSAHFQRGSQTAFAMSNAIQTQVARMSEYRARQPRPATQPPLDLGPDVASGAKREDLFVFTVKDLSLKKGERMVVPVAEFRVPYEDVYTVNLEMSPPLELTRQFNNNQQQELARLFHAPKAIHKARLTNNSKFPLTTAPALILRKGQLLGQAMMTYTPIGGRVDVEMTTAVDISVVKNDVETKRTPNAANWGGRNYDRVDLKGEIKLRNYSSKPVKLEVVRVVLGNVDKIGADGKTKRVNAREEGWHLASGYPPWWNWIGWPSGWFHLNGIGQLNWQTELDAGKEISLPYQWHYFWHR